LEPSKAEHLHFVEWLRRDRVFGKQWSCLSGVDEQAICAYFAVERKQAWTHLSKNYQYLTWKPEWRDVGPLKMLHYMMRKPWMLLEDLEERSSKRDQFMSWTDARYWWTVAAKLLLETPQLAPWIPRAGCYLFHLRLTNECFHCHALHASVEPESKAIVGSSYSQTKGVKGPCMFCQGVGDARQQPLALLAQATHEWIVQAPSGVAPLNALEVKSEPMALATILKTTRSVAIATLYHIVQHGATLEKSQNMVEDLAFYQSGEFKTALEAIQAKAKQRKQLKLNAEAEESRLVETIPSHQVPIPLEQDRVSLDVLYHMYMLTGQQWNVVLGICGYL